MSDIVELVQEIIEEAIEREEAKKREAMAVEPITVSKEKRKPQNMEQ